MNNTHSFESSRARGRMLDGLKMRYISSKALDVPHAVDGTYLAWRASEWFRCQTDEASEAIRHIIRGACRMCRFIHRRRDVNTFPISRQTLVMVSLYLSNAGFCGNTRRAARWISWRMERDEDNMGTASKVFGAVMQYREECLKKDSKHDNILPMKEFIIWCFATPMMCDLSSPDESPIAQWMRSRGHLEAISPVGCRAVFNRADNGSALGVIPLALVALISCYVAHGVRKMSMLEIGFHTRAVLANTPHGEKIDGLEW